jgi:hypothetical protein
MHDGQHDHEEAMDLAWRALRALRFLQTTMRLTLTHPELMEPADHLFHLIRHGEVERAHQPIEKWAASTVPAPRQDGVVVELRRWPLRRSLIDRTVMPLVRHVSRGLGACGGRLEASACAELLPAVDRLVELARLSHVEHESRLIAELI